MCVNTPKFRDSALDEPRYPKYQLHQCPAKRQEAQRWQWLSGTISLNTATHFVHLDATVSSVQWMLVVQMSYSSQDQNHKKQRCWFIIYIYILLLWLSIEVVGMVVLDAFSLCTCTGTQHCVVLCVFLFVCFFWVGWGWGFFQHSAKCAQCCSSQSQKECRINKC